MNGQRTVAQVLCRSSKKGGTVKKGKGGEGKKKKSQKRRKKMGGSLSHRLEILTTKNIWKTIGGRGGIRKVNDQKGGGRHQKRKGPYLDKEKEEKKRKKNPRGGKKVNNKRYNKWVPTKGEIL